MSESVSNCCRHCGCIDPTDGIVTDLRARVRELEGARTTAIREAVERLSDEVIAGVRQRKARILGTLPDNFTTLMDVQAMSVMKDDLTTLASACERLAEENERLRGERVVLAMLATDGPAFSSPLHAAMAKALRDRVLAEATPAPAGKAGDMSTGLTIDISAPAGK